jgi:5-methylcytosine-specific restriction endonuclease McrA
MPETWGGRPLSTKPHSIRARELSRIKYAQMRELLGGKCQVCGRSPRRLETHHLSYPNGQRIKGGNAYQRFREVKANPSNFVLLCRGCHQAVTILTTSGQREKIMHIVNQTRPWW